MLRVIIFTVIALSSIGCQKMNTNVLNIPISSAVNLKKLDGKKIVTAIQYQLLINLNLTLLEYDKKGNLVTLLAEDYDIEDRVINFKIKKGVKTIGGHEIIARDAEVSLKRLIMNNDGSHSRLADLLCSEESNVVSNKCPGISSDGYELKITAQKKSYIPFILTLLTNADNVILPLTALSSSLPNSEIINFKETTGPYYIDSDRLVDERIEKIKLILNRKHFLYEDKLASEVDYSLGDLNTVLKGKYNYIHSVVGLSSHTIKEAEASGSVFTLHQTLPIKNTIIFSTQKGRKNFSSDELIGYGLKIKSFLLNSKEYYPNIVQTQISYFPAESDGTLRDDQYAKVIKKYDELKNFTFETSRKIKVGVYKALFDKYTIAFRSITNIEIVLIESSPLDKNKEEVDLYITAMDSSFTESLDLLQYNKNFGIFDVTDTDMNNYINAESKEIRIKLLQDIHVKSLLQGRFINIGASPYYTILNKDWEVDPPKFFAGFPVWKIKRKN